MEGAHTSALNWRARLLQDNWQKSDGSQATRADLMLVLSDINRFLIRATQANRMTESM